MKYTKREQREMAAKYTPKTIRFEDIKEGFRFYLRADDNGGKMWFEVVDFEYDWAKYFREALAGEYSPLEKKRIRISVDNEVHRTNWKDYALEAVWFGVNGITLNPGMKSEYI